MDFSIIIDNIGIYLEGLQNTLILVSISLVIGLLLALPLALLRMYGNRYVQLPVRAFIYFFRGTPLLVQMFLVYYGFGQFELMKTSVFWHLFREAYFCALFTFTLNTAAYTTEILRGAIKATSHGEIEAAMAAGMSRLLMIRRIILPSAFRRALPAYSNEIIFTVGKGKSIRQTINIITRQSGIAQSMVIINGCAASTARVRAARFGPINAASNPPAKTQDTALEAYLAGATSIAAKRKY